jgi:hypothetical protein
MTAPEMRLAWQRFVEAWRFRPYITAFAVGLTPVGVLAIIYGDKVSKALGNLTADVVSRGMGFALFTGGIVTFLGIVTHRALSQTIGMAFLAVGLGVYGVGVILGLGLGGMVAGPIALLACAATVRRIITMAQGDTRSRLVADS